MLIDRKTSPTAVEPQPAAAQPWFRSGAVARIAHMPVSTLRIWEQRYKAVGPSTAPSGHRLYSATDVQRVLLLRQLTEQGHAIGAIAALDAAQLQQVATTHASHVADKRDQPPLRTTALRIAVVGRALALRLQRPAFVKRLAHPWQVTVVFESLAEAAHADSGEVVDVLLWQVPGLQLGTLAELKAAQDALHARQVAVVYRYAGLAARRAFAFTGARLVLETADDDALGAWLASLGAWALARDDVWNLPLVSPGSPDLAPDQATGDVTPRRFDDAALTKFAGLPTTFACECPRHVAELLMQLSHFETYSADCANRSPDDAELHAYLQRVAGLSRTLFESALERVAHQEGLTLP